MSDEKTTRATAFYIVREIIRDLSDRKELSDEWGQIDLDVQQEIRERWEQLAAETMDPRLVSFDDAWGEAKEADVHWRRGWRPKVVFKTEQT